MFPKHLLVALLFNGESGKKNTSSSSPSSSVTYSLASVLAGYSSHTLSLLVTRAGAAASRLQNLPLSSACTLYTLQLRPLQELPQAGLQPGVWDLCQTLPWPYRQLWVFSGSSTLVMQERSQKSPTGAFLIQSLSGQSVGWGCFTNPALPRLPKGHIQALESFSPYSRCFAVFVCLNRV